MIANFSRLDSGLHTCGYATANSKQLENNSPTKTEFSVQNLFINGHYVPAHSDMTFDIRDPQSNKIIAKVSNASQHDLLNAINSAVRAYEHFKRHGEEDRRKLLIRIASQMDILNRHISVDNLADVTLAIKVFETFAAYGNGMSALTGRVRSELSIHHPEAQLEYSINSSIGPIGAILSSTLPLYTIASIVAPCILFGNSLVIKASEYCPISLFLGNVFSKAGVPSGFINILNGNGYELGVELTRSHYIKKIIFSGSEHVANLLTEQCLLNRPMKSIKYMNNKATAIIINSTNVDKLVKKISETTFATESKVNDIKIDRIFVHVDCLPILVDKLNELIKAKGPVILNDRDFKRTTRYLENHHCRASHNVDNCSIMPQVIVTKLENLCEGTYHMASEESFGPVINIFVFNDSNFGESKNIIQIVNDFNRTLRTQYNVIFSSKPLTDTYFAAQLSSDYILFNSINLIQSIKLVGDAAVSFHTEKKYIALNDSFEYKNIVGGEGIP